MFLGHVMAQAVKELDPDLRVGFFGHEENHEAMKKGEIDLYAEYDGTALHRYLELGPKPRADVHRLVQEGEREKWNIEWLEPIGSDNTYGIMVRASLATTLGLRTIADLAPHAPTLTLAATERYLLGHEPLTFAPGSYPGFMETYGFSFGATVGTDASYASPFKAMERGEADVVADFVVNPFVEELDLVELIDDRDAFTAYYLAPIVRGEVLDRLPGLRPLLERMAWKIDSRAMARINYLVDFEGRDPVELAAEFLASLDEKVPSG